MPLSYRGQAQQRPGQFSVVSCWENQTRGEAMTGVEGEADVLTGIIWGDTEESSEIMVKRKIRVQGSHCMSM